MGGGWCAHSGARAAPFACAMRIACSKGWGGLEQCGTQVCCKLHGRFLIPSQDQTGPCHHRSRRAGVTFNRPPIIPKTPKQGTPHPTQPPRIPIYPPPRSKAAAAPAALSGAGPASPPQTPPRQPPRETAGKLPFSARWGAMWRACCRCAAAGRTRRGRTAGRGWTWGRMRRWKTIGGRRRRRGGRGLGVTRGRHGMGMGRRMWCVGTGAGGGGWRGGVDGWGLGAKKGGLMNWERRAGEEQRGSGCVWTRCRGGTDVMQGRCRRLPQAG